ncbi:hypothetical protein AMTRI_Chr01g104400 [Amborella trichopoda]
MWHLMHHIMNYLLLEIRIHLSQIFIYFFNCVFLPHFLSLFVFLFFCCIFFFLPIGLFCPYCIEFILQVCSILLIYLPLTWLRTKHIVSFGPIRRQQIQREQIHMEQLQRRGYVVGFFFSFFLKCLLLNYCHY